jgi:hypothetical protein
MTSIECPLCREVWRVPSADRDQTLARHVAICGACASAEAEVRALAAAAQRLPIEPVSSDRIDRIREAIVAHAIDVQARRPRSRRIRRGLAIAGLAAGIAVAVAAFWIRSAPANDPPIAERPSILHKGTVRPEIGAELVDASGLPDERFELHEGTIAVDVAPLAVHERFRIITTDAEIEVRGTAFEVTARRGTLVGVRVVSGRVEVRQGGQSLILGSGEVWPIPVASAPPAPSSDRVGNRAKLLKQIQRPEPSKGSDEQDVAHTAARDSEIAFDEAIAEMRRSEFAGAAETFGRALALDPEGPLAEDARYWHAVALARSNDDAHARIALADFLDHHPRSVRRGEASVMLGTILLAMRDFDGAERRFADAADDVVPEVRARAKAGLDAVHRGRASDDAFPP